MVLIEYGKTSGNVTAVVETKSEMKQFGVDEAGIMLSSKPFGLVYWPSPYPEDPVIFKEREKT